MSPFKKAGIGRLLVQKWQAFARSHEGYEFALAFFVVASVITFGTLGYHKVEGWNFFDSLYMTVITLATVGFGEVHPLSQEGRMFTVVLIVMGVVVASAVLPVVAGRVIEKQLAWLTRRRNMQSDIDKLTGHTIFCGYGRLGSSAVRQYRPSDEQLVVVDHSDERVLRAREAGVLVVKGDATMDETLLAAGIKRARRLVTLLPKDADNLYVILTGRELNPGLFIMSYAQHQTDERRLLRAGANKVISPFIVGGQKIANGLLRPYVTDFLDIAVSPDRDELHIEEIRIPETSPLSGHTLQEAEIRKKANVMVAAVIQKSGKMLISPDAGTVLEGGATLIALGLKNELQILEQILLGEGS